MTETNTVRVICQHRWKGCFQLSEKVLDTKYKMLFWLVTFSVRHEGRPSSQHRGFQNRVSSKLPNSLLEDGPLQYWYCGNVIFGVTLAIYDNGRPLGRTGHTYVVLVPHAAVPQGSIFSQWVGFQEFDGTVSFCAHFESWACRHKWFIVCNHGSGRGDQETWDAQASSTCKSQFILVDPDHHYAVSWHSLHWYSTASLLLP